VTAPSIVVPGATTALTRRTTLRKAFLAPWHPLVEPCWLYSLADAQRHTGVAVHHSVLNVTHHHTDVTPSFANLPEFIRRFHRDLSCSLHVLLCAERYDAPREIFDDRPTHCMRLLDAPAQASHLVYEHLNPVAAGLVARPEHMPMRTLDFSRWKAGYVEVERPPVYFSEDRPERLRLYLTPPPLLYRAFGGDLDALVHHMGRLVEDGIRALRDVRRRPPTGARALRRLHPWSEPTTLREPGGGPRPTFRSGARGIVGRRQRIDGARDTRRFRAENREARIARRDGDLERRFPYATYGMRVYHGAPVEDAPAEYAVVTRPGPTLEDVKTELAVLGPEAFREGARELVHEVRGALRDEAADIVEHDDLELCDIGLAPTVTTATRDERTPSEAHAPLVVRHRFDRRPKERPSAARLVVLRDRRRGRPPSGSSRHGSDPPV
jgi:hypothetical protein